METIKNLALASEAFRVFVPDSRIPQSIYESIQQRAHRIAAIASKLPVAPKIRDVTVVSALLHDVGRHILASKTPDKFCFALSLASERGCQDFEAEEELLGISHAEIGAYLLGLWVFPNLAVEAIAHHHRPTRISHSGFDAQWPCMLQIYWTTSWRFTPGIRQGRNSMRLRELASRSWGFCRSLPISWFCDANSQLKSRSAANPHLFILLS